MLGNAATRRVLLDGNNLTIAAQSTTGHLLNGTLYGFIKILGVIFKKYPDCPIYVAWDSSKNWRFLAYDGYKGKRRNKERTPEDQESYEKFKEQREKIKKFMYKLPIIQIEVEGYEADDIAGYFARHYPSILVSNDKDWLCLVQGETELYRHIVDMTITEENFTDYTGFKNGVDFTRMKAIVGDPMDDVPGIPGVGEQTAKAFLNGALISGTKYEKIKAWLSDSEGYARSLKLVDIWNSCCDQYTYIWSPICNVGSYDFKTFDDLIYHYRFKSIDSKKWDEFLQKHWRVLQEFTQNEHN